jgi:hypothetical protein
MLPFLYVSDGEPSSGFVEPDLTISAVDSGSRFAGVAYSQRVSGFASDGSPVSWQASQLPSGASLTDNGDGTADVAWANPTEGAAQFVLVASTIYGATKTTSWTIVFEAQQVTGSIDLAALPVTSPTDISSDALDWVYWGLGGIDGVDRKDTTPIIGTLAPIGSAWTWVGGSNLSSARQRLTWTGGAPTPSFDGSVTAALQQVNNDSGFSLPVPASTNTRDVLVYCTSRSAQMRLTATLGSLSKSIDIPNSGTIQDHVIRVRVRSDSAATLTIGLVKLAPDGSSGAQIRAAALIAVAGGGLSWDVPLETNAYEPLIATVTAGDAPSGSYLLATNLPGNAEFVSTGTGTAELRWTPGVADVAFHVITINLMGSDGSVLLTQNFSIVVSAATAPPPSISFSGPLTFNRLGSDSVTVTATGDSPITMVVDGLPESATWLADGDTAVLSWSPSAGVGNAEIAITATDASGRVSTSAHTLEVSEFGASLSLSGATPADSSIFNLTTMGTLDWLHRALTVVGDINRKSGGGSLIGLSAIGGGNLARNLQGSVRPRVSWTDGTPTASATESYATVAVLTSTVGAGIRVTVPTTSTTRTITIIGTMYQSSSAADNSEIEVTASMGGLTAPAITYTPAPAQNVNYVLTIAAQSSGNDEVVIDFVKKVAIGTIRISGVTLA